LKGTTYRGDVDLLHHIVKIIIHCDAWYLHHFPHRTYQPISAVSIPFSCPQENDVDDDIIDDDDDDDNNIGNDDDDRMDDEMMPANSNSNERRSDWSHVDTGNSFSSFMILDVVMAWYDDKFYLGTICEVDVDNELFTVHFHDDDMEVDSYNACWLQHLQ
jgi:hypothetical protein